MGRLNKPFKSNSYKYLENLDMCRFRSYYVYVLADNRGDTYVGITMDPTRRLKEHREKKSKTTANMVGIRRIRLVKLPSQKMAIMYENLLIAIPYEEYIEVIKTKKSFIQYTAKFIKEHSKPVKQEIPGTKYCHQYASGIMVLSHNEPLPGLELIAIHELGKEPV